MTAPTLREAANWYCTKRHYSADLNVDHGEGRSGFALCATEVYDQGWHDAMHRRYGGMGKRTVVADLPLCKRCEREAAQR